MSRSSFAEKPCSSPRPAMISSTGVNSFGKVPLFQLVRAYCRKRGECDLIHRGRRSTSATLPKFRIVPISARKLQAVVLSGALQVRALSALPSPRRYLSLA